VTAQVLVDCLRPGKRIWGFQENNAMISSSIPPLALVEVEAIQKKNVEINYSYLQNGISHGNVQS
jgi:hypothetical protein